MKQNQKGSILVYAVIIILLLLIIIGTGLTVSFSYFNRSLSYVVKQQVFYTAQSSVEAIVGGLNSEKQTDKDRITPTKEKPTINIKDITYAGAAEDDYRMVDSSGSITWVDDKHLKISVQAEQNDMKYTMHADVVLMKSSSDIVYWEIYQMYDDNTNFPITPSETK